MATGLPASITGRVRVYWSGPAPSNCQRCDVALTTEFIDLAAPYGHRGIICPGCYSSADIWRNPGGPLHGPGRYDRTYIKQPNGTWMYEGYYPKDYPRRPGEVVFKVEER
jgi:hypothetical protein